MQMKQIFIIDLSELIRENLNSLLKENSGIDIDFSVEKKKREREERTKTGLEDEMHDCFDLDRARILVSGENKYT